MFRILRWVILAVLVIGLPYFIYIGFIADEPVLEVEYDVELGRQTVASIAEDPEEYPVLPPEEYPEAYAYLQSIVDKLVASDEIQYADLFAYDNVRLIARDDVLNAFCSPGGFIYVYTGLIKYLDAEDHLAGVLGHEIAHAERRHSAMKLQREYGRQRILALLAIGAPVTLSEVVMASMLNDLKNLSYGRDQEAESDALSVQYLDGSGYACNGTAGFFAKLLNEAQDVGIPEFLSSHPDSRARVRDINAAAEALGCSTALADPSGWAAFQAMMPGSEREGEDASTNP